MSDCKAPAHPAGRGPRYLAAEGCRWWAADDLNLRPHAYQACALTPCATGHCTVTSPPRAAFRHTGMLSYRHSFAVAISRMKGHEDGGKCSLEWRKLFRPQGPALSAKFLRKEVIQPQVPLRLPCYDFTPVADPTVVACPPCGLAQRLRVSTEAHKSEHTSELQSLM